MYYNYDDNFDPMRFENDECECGEEMPFVCPFLARCPFCSDVRQEDEDYETRQPNMPPGPPPTYTPTKNMQAPSGPNLKAVDPGAIRICRYKYTYIWETNGNAYWAYITFVGPRSIAGYRWMRRRWVYFGLDLRRIESFTCR